MKTSICTLLLLLLSLGHLSAQEKAGFYVDFAAGFANETPDHHARLTPGVGYQFNDKWAAGLRATFQTSNPDENVILTPYARYTLVQAGRFGLYTDASASWAIQKSKYDGNPTDPNYRSSKPPYFEGGLNIGVKYDLTSHVGLFANGFFLGYSNTAYTHEGAVVGNGRLIFDANWRRMAVGVKVVF